MSAAALAAWFATRGWKPFAFQRAVWKAIAAGESGMLHATTGAGKTYAVWLGALNAFAKPPKTPTKPTTTATRATTKKLAPPLTVLWITPMRALASDTLRALQQPLEALAPDWSAGARQQHGQALGRGHEHGRQARVLRAALGRGGVAAARARGPGGRQRFERLLQRAQRVGRQRPHRRDPQHGQRRCELLRGGTRGRRRGLGRRLGRLRERVQRTEPHRIRFACAGRRMQHAGLARGDGLPH
ncbi:MAG: DEAD/DEAH box helicase, partial [Variovorax sp.]